MEGTESQSQSDDQDIDHEEEVPLDKNQELSDLSSELSKLTSGNFDTSNGISVVLRVRPISELETQNKEKSAVKFPGKGQIVIESSTCIRHFTFNVVFETEAVQSDVFEYSGVKKLIDLSLEGYSCTCFAYGQTGSGKTHTLTGPPQDFLLSPEPNSDNFGIMPRSFVYLYQHINNNPDTTFRIHVSYFEIYNEQIIDLLNPRPMYPLNVRWRKEQGFYVDNLFVIECDSVDDLMAVMETGMKNRAFNPTNPNEFSSRSHSMLTVMIDTQTRDPEDPAIVYTKHGKLTFVDLAGSEKCKDGVDLSTEQLQESKDINRSLLVLGNCISALSDTKKKPTHIPYRDSKLTKLLADSLGGNGITLMIACISSASGSSTESMNTLRYAQRARKIKNQPIVNLDPPNDVVRSLKLEIKRLQRENEALRAQKTTLERERTRIQTERREKQSKKNTQRESKGELDSGYDREPSEADSLEENDAKNRKENFNNKESPLYNTDRISSYNNDTKFPAENQRNDNTKPNNFSNYRGTSSMGGIAYPQTGTASHYPLNSKMDPIKSDFSTNGRKSTVRDSYQDDASLYEMLQEYMVENEGLRKENSNLQKHHEDSIKEKEHLMRENDQMSRKIEDLKKYLDKQKSMFERERQSSQNSSHVSGLNNSRPNNLNPRLPLPYPFDNNTGLSNSQTAGNEQQRPLMPISQNYPTYKYTSNEQGKTNPSSETFYKLQQQYVIPRGKFPDAGHFSTPNQYLPHGYRSDHEEPIPRTLQEHRRGVQSGGDPPNPKQLLNHPHQGLARAFQAPHYQQDNLLMSPPNSSSTFSPAYANPILMRMPDPLTSLPPPRSRWSHHNPEADVLPVHSPEQYRSLYNTSPNVVYAVKRDSAVRSNSQNRPTAIQDGSTLKLPPVNRIPTDGSVADLDEVNKRLREELVKLDGVILKHRRVNAFNNGLRHV